MYSNKKIDLVSLNASMNGFACGAAKIASGLLFACIMSINVSLWSSAPNADNAFDKRNLDLLFVGEHDLPGCESVQDCSDDDLFGGRADETLEELQDDLGDFLAVVSGTCKDYDAADARGEVSKGVGAVSGKRKRAGADGTTEQPAAKRAGAGERLFVCDYPGCLYRSVQSEHLKTHKRMHTGEKPYVCGIDGCTHAATQMGHLKRHQATHTGEKPFECAFAGCNYACTRPDALELHAKRHANARLFVCDFAGCNYAANEASILKIHKRVHTGEKPYVCDFTGCNYASAGSNSLKQHRRMHTAVCVVDGCDFTTADKRYLNTLMRRDTGEGSYVYGIEGCNYASVRSDNLKMHTGAKPYVCDFAGCLLVVTHKH